MSLPRMTHGSWPRSVALFAGLMLLNAVPFGRADAEEIPRMGLRNVMRLMQEPVIPQEWSGVWSIVDSTFSCTGVFMGETSMELDTLCTGAPAGPAEAEAEGPVFEVTCSGTVDATSADITCSGAAPISEACLATFTSTTQATRSGDRYTATVEIMITYAGTGAECSLIPSFCQRVTTHGTRVGPQPQDCGSVAVTNISWNLFKQLYR